MQQNEDGFYQPTIIRQEQSVKCGFCTKVCSFLNEQTNSQPKANVHVSLQQVNYKGILSDRTIVVTGGSRGIRFSMAKKYVSEGVKVLITGHSEEGVEESSFRTW